MVDTQYEEHLLGLPLKFYVREMTITELLGFKLDGDLPHTQL
jgi:hypothetical protein